MVAFCRRSWISRSTNSSWVLPRSSPAETRTSPWAPCWCTNLHPTSARWLLCRGMQSFVRDSRLREKETKTLALSLSLSPLAANNSVCEEKKLGKKIAASIRGSSSEKVYIETEPSFSFVFAVAEIDAFPKPLCVPWPFLFNRIVCSSKLDKENLKKKKLTRNYINMDANEREKFRWNGKWEQRSRRAGWEPLS